ncbi:MAG: hypothetical protein EBS34_12680, partial [Flavobacteriales bacterium]|nr:hypothetical protein [Flavobacteriales bacterium]
MKLPILFTFLILSCAFLYQSQEVDKSAFFITKTIVETYIENYTEKNSSLKDSYEKFKESNKNPKDIKEFYKILDSTDWKSTKSKIAEKTFNYLTKNNFSFSTNKDTILKMNWLEPDQLEYLVKDTANIRKALEKQPMIKEVVKGTSGNPPVEDPIPPKQSNASTFPNYFNYFLLMINLICIIFIVFHFYNRKKKRNEKNEEQQGSLAQSRQQTSNLVNGPQVNSEVEKLRKENEGLKLKNKDLEQKNNDLEQVIKNLKQENQELKNQVEDLRNKIDNILKPGPGQPPPIPNKEILFFPVPSQNGVFKGELGSTIQRTNISYYRFVLESESNAKV